MTWRCKVEDDWMTSGVKIAIADTHQDHGQLLHFDQTSTTSLNTAAELPDTAWLRLPRDAATALMLELQAALAPDRRSVDREVLEHQAEALAIERARVDMILDRDNRVIITDGTGKHI